MAGKPRKRPYRLIPLTQNQNAIVDVADYEWLNQWSWTAMWDPHTRSFRATRSLRSGTSSKHIYMHRLILGCTGKELGDHENHNTLDNRRKNLRKCTIAENNRNCKKQRKNTSGFKGVCWHKRERKWRAQISVNGKRKYLGSFSVIQDAIAAYDSAARTSFGQFAYPSSPGSLDSKVFCAGS